MSSKKRERLLSDKTKASLKRKPVMMGDVEVYAWELTSKQKTTLEASNMNSKGEADPEKFSDYRSRVLIVGVRDSGEDGAPRTFEDGDEMDVFPSLRDLTRPPPKPLAVQKAEARARAELSRRRNRG
jgi:hypothetical protein